MNQKYGFVSGSGLHRESVGVTLKWRNGFRNQMVVEAVKGGFDGYDSID